MADGSARNINTGNSDDVSCFYSHIEQSGINV